MKDDCVDIAELPFVSVDVVPEILTRTSEVPESDSASDTREGAAILDEVVAEGEVVPRLVSDSASVNCELWVVLGAVTLGAVTLGAEEEEEEEEGIVTDEMRVDFESLRSPCDDFDGVWVGVVSVTASSGIGGLECCEGK